MASEGYHVLRLIEHSQSCYVSSEFVQGRTLIQWLKYHPDIPKEQLFSWMYEIMRQLALFHRLRGNPCYQYVNPYSIIVSSEEKLYLLDAGDGSNEALMKKMHRRAVRENFLPPEEGIYSKPSAGQDIYGLGRTWQYMLSVTEPDPALTKREERRLQKVISRCLNRQSKNAYQNIKEIQTHFPVYKTKKIHAKPPGKLLILAAVLAAAAAGIKVSVYSGEEEKPVARTEQKEERTAGEKSKKEKTVKEDSSEELLKFDMGMLCLLELKEYGRAAGYLEEIGQYGADCYAMIARYMERDTAASEKEQLAEALSSAEKEIPAEREKTCIHGLITGYRLLGTEEADENIARLGDIFLGLDSEGEDSGEAQKEIMEAMAGAYEEMEKKKEAVSMYEEILKCEEEEKKKEGLYKKMTLLWEELDEKEKAWECCRKGIEELPDSVELRLLHIRMLCKDASVDRTVCADTVRQYLADIPEMAEEEEFKKLQKEYDIRVEGEEVWAGR